jgi:hypothetical protein
MGKGSDSGTDEGCLSKARLFVIDFVDPSLKQYNRPGVLTLVIVLLSLIGLGEITANILFSPSGACGEVDLNVNGITVAAALKSLNYECFYGIRRLQKTDPNGISVNGSNGVPAFMSGYITSNECRLDGLPGIPSFAYCEGHPPPSSDSPQCVLDDRTYFYEIGYRTCPAITSFGAALGYRSTLFVVISLVVVNLLKVCGVIKPQDRKVGLKESVVKQLRKAPGGVRDAAATPSNRCWCLQVKFIDFINPGLKKYNCSFALAMMVTLLGLGGLGALFYNQLSLSCGTYSKASNGASIMKYVSNIIFLSSILPLTPSMLLDCYCYCTQYIAHPHLNTRKLVDGSVTCLRHLGNMDTRTDGYITARDCQWETQLCSEPESRPRGYFCIYPDQLQQLSELKWCQGYAPPSKNLTECKLYGLDFQMEMVYDSCSTTAALGAALGYREILFAVVSLLLTTALKVCGLVKEQQTQVGLKESIIEQVKKM